MVGVGDRDAGLGFGAGGGFGAAKNLGAEDLVQKVWHRRPGAEGLARKAWRGRPGKTAFHRRRQSRCDKASLDAAVMLHLRYCYVSKAAILTIPVRSVPVENRSPA